MLFALLAALPFSTLLGQAGEPENPRLLVETFTSYKSINSRPVAVDDRNGGMYVVYKSIRGDLDYGNLYAQHIDAEGNPLWPEDGLRLCPSEGDQDNPQVLPDTDGGLIVVWEDYRFDRQQPVIFAQRLNAQGENLWPAQGVQVAQTVSGQTSPVIQPDQDDGFFIFWKQQRRGSGGNLLVGQRIRADGSKTWRPQGMTVSIAPGLIQNLQLAYAPGKQVLLLWEDFRNKSDWQLYGQLVNANGRPEWSELGICLADTATINQRYPSVYGDGFGGMMLVYEQLSPQSNSRDIYIQRVNRRGEIIYQEPICQAVRDQKQPQLVQLGANALVFWEDNRTGEGDIYAQRVHISDGSVLWRENGIPLCQAPGNQRKPRCVTSSLYGDQVVVWEDDRQGVVNLYGQKVTREGEIAWAPIGLPLVESKMPELDFQLVPDQRGGCWLAWIRDERLGGRPYYQHVNRRGEPQSPKGLPLFFPHRQQSVKIGLLTSTGGLHQDAYVAWEDYRNGKDNPDIYIQRLLANGRESWRLGGVPVIAHPDRQEVPKLLATPGGVLVSWIDRRNGDDDLYVQFMDTTGLTHGPPNGHALCRAPRSQHGLQWRLLPDGSVLTAWTDARDMDLKGFDVFFRKLDETGAPLDSGNGAPVTQLPGYQTSPSLVSATHGASYLIWMDDRSGKYNLYGQLLDSTGQRHWNPRGKLLVDYPVNQRFPVFVRTPRNTLFGAWTDDRAGADLGSVVTQEFGPDGQPLWSSNGLPISTRYTRQLYPHILADDRNGRLVLWQEQKRYEKGPTQLFLQRLDTLGEPRWGKDALRVSAGLALNADYGLHRHASTISVFWDQGFDPDGTSVHYAEYDLTSGRTIRRVKFSPEYDNLAEPELADFGNGTYGLFWVDRREEDQQSRLMFWRLRPQVHFKGGER